MIKRKFVLFLLITIFLSACDPPFTQPISEIPTPEESTPAPLTIDNSKWSPTGFYWPTKKGDPKEFNNWLYETCSWSGKDNYIEDYYHIGMDITGAIGNEVFAIADGRVVGISRNNLNDPVRKATVESGGDPAGWGIDNIAILIEHKLADGRSFVAVYGHIKDDPDNDIHTGKKKDIYVEEIIGRMGPYPLSDPHLHLGIFEIIPDGPTKPSINLGRMRCPDVETSLIELNKNGFASPYVWLTTEYPAPNKQNPAILDPGVDETNEWPSISSTIIAATLAPGVGANEKCTLLQENAVYAKLGQYMHEFFLIGDSRIWKTEDNTEWPETSPKPPPIILRHLGNIQCVIKVFKEETLPPQYTLSEHDEFIGNTQYHVEDFQYASPLHIKKFTLSNMNKQIAVVSEDGNDQCFVDASQVLLCSELIRFGPFDLPSTSSPVNPSADLTTFVFGYNLELMLTYDKNLWISTDWSSGFNAIELINTSGCAMHQNLGVGAPEWWKRNVSQEIMGSYDFRVEQWTDTKTNQVVLISYNIDEKNISIAIEPGSGPETCLEAARQVLNYSVENDFGPIK